MNSKGILPSKFMYSARIRACPPDSTIITTKVSNDETQGFRVLLIRLSIPFLPPNIRLNLFKLHPFVAEPAHGDYLKAVAGGELITKLGDIDVDRAKCRFRFYPPELVHQLSP